MPSPDQPQPQPTNPSGGTPTEWNPPTTPGGQSTQGAGPIGRALARGFAQVGTVYSFGAMQPGAAFDCSGLTEYVYKNLLSLPHSAAAQSQILPHVTNLSDLQPGDLIFYNYGRLGPNTADHVAIYLGGGLQLAASSSADHITVQSVDTSHFMYGGSVAQAAGVTSPSPAQVRSIGLAAGVQVANGVGALGDPYSPGTYYRPTTAPGTVGSMTALQKQAQVRAQENATASYESLLQQWQIPMTPALQNMVSQDATQMVSVGVFAQQLRQTKDYAQAFPGLIGPNGVPRMSESQYISGFNSVVDYAASVGQPMPKGLYGAAIKAGNSPSELKSKIQALDSLRSNSSLMADFSQYLVATGVTKKPPDRQELAKFLMGQGPKQFEAAWTSASEQAALEQANVTVGGKAGDIGIKQLKRLSDQLLPGQTPDYGALAKAVTEAIPPSKLYGMGLTKKDLVKMAFYAPGADKVAARVRQVVDTYQLALTEPGAQGASQQTINRYGPPQQPQPSE